MARIKNTDTYPLKASPSEDDFLIGTDSEDDDTTVSFLLSDIVSLGDLTLEGYTESGTRAAGTLIVTIGDYDDSNTGHSITIDVANLLNTLDNDTSIGNDLTVAGIITGSTMTLDGAVSNTTLSLDSTTGALRVSRLTTTQRDALTPLTGMTIFNTTTVQMEGYNGTEWIGTTGVDEWTDLTDTESSISAGLVVQGNSGGTALEFGQALAITDSPTFVDLTLTGDLTVDSPLLFVDSTNDFVGIGTLSPVDMLDVVDESGTPAIRIEGATSNIRHVSGTNSYNVVYSQTTGSAIINFRALPVDGTSGAAYRFGNTSGTTGTNSIQLFESNSSTVQTNFRSSGNTSYINSQGGNLSVGSTSAAVLLDVTSSDADTVAIFGLEATGTNGDRSETFVGTQDPEGNITGSPGDYYYRVNGTDSGLFVFQAASAGTAGWNELIDASIGVTTSDVLTDNFLVRGNGTLDVDIGNIFMSSDGDDLTIPGDLIVDTNTLFVDSTNDFVGIGTVSPADLLDVVNSSGAAGIRIEGAAANVRHVVNAEYDITYTRTTGIPIIDFRALPSDGTSDANYRFGLSSGSTGANVISLFDANGSTVQTSLRSSGLDSFINSQGGNLAIGSTSAAVLLDVTSSDADTVAFFSLEATGTNGARSETFVGTQDPEGTITGSPGDYYYRVNGVDSGLFVFQAASSGTAGWNELIDASIGVVTTDTLTSLTLVVGDGTTSVQAAELSNSSIQTNAGFNSILITPESGGTANFTLLDDTQTLAVDLNWDELTGVGTLTSPNNLDIISESVLQIIALTQTIILTSTDVELVASDEIDLTAMGIIDMNSGAAITLDADTFVTIESLGGSVGITASTSVNITAAVNSVNLLAAVEVDITATAGPIDLNSGSSITLDTVTFIDLSATTTVLIDALGGSVDITGSTDVNITATADDVNIQAADEIDLTTTSGTIDINSGAGVLINSVINTSIGALGEINLTSVSTMNFNPGSFLTIETDDRVTILNNNTFAGVNAGLTIEQTGTGDAVLHFELTGGQDWSLGIDNSNSDIFAITPAVSISTSGVLQMTIDGEIGINKTPRANHALDIDSTATTVVSLYDSKDVTIESGNLGNGNSTDFFFNRADVGFNQSEFHLFNDNNNLAASRYFELNYTDATGGGIQILADGNVGIGQIAPTQMLHLLAETTSDAKILIQDDGAVDRVSLGWDESSTQTNLTLTGDGAELFLNVASLTNIISQVTTGVNIWNFRALCLDGTSSATYRFGINSGSTGNQSIQFFEPNGAVLSARIGSVGLDSFINSQGNMFGVGNAAPTTMLHTTSTGDDDTAVITVETTGSNAGVTTKFVGSRDPDGNVTGAGGDEYYRDSTTTSGSYESLEATTGTNWFRRSLNPPTIVEINNVDQLEELATASVITVSSKLVIIQKVAITSAVEFVLETGGTLILKGDAASDAWVYTGTGDFISGTGNVNMSNILVVSVSTGTFVSMVLASTNFFIFRDNILVSFADLGDIDGGTVVLDSSLYSTWSAGFTITNPVVFNSKEVTTLGGSTTANLYEVSNDLAVASSTIIRDVGGTLLGTSSLIRVDAGINNDARVQLLNNSIGVADGLFDTSGGTTGTATGTTDSSVSGIVITSVTDLSGVAVFNFTGPTVFVHQEVVISGFTTNTDYNGTFIITIATVGEFVVGSIAFGSDETGLFSLDSITVADVTHGLVGGDTITVSGNPTDYDGGATVYNADVNDFQINRTFTSSILIDWDTSPIDQTDIRVLAFQNPESIDSGYIAAAFVNDNLTVNGGITNNVFTDMVFGTGGDALVEGSTIERWKLLDELNGTFEYTGNEPFSGSITFDFTVESTGGTVDFRFKWQKSTDGGSSFVDLADNVESLVTVGGDPQSVTKTFPLAVDNGDQIKPQITRNSGGSTITTIYASIYANNPG